MSAVVRLGKENIMGIGFYPHLAWDSIRKNKRMYVPYILTCTGMVMMFYMIAFLAGDPVLRTVRGGSIVMEMLGLGVYVIIIFAAIFLFYTNSFLIKRRKKEFGLYNVLGMGKGNLARVLLWECLQIAFISLAAGLFLGMVFAKLGELAMVYIIRGENNYNISINFEALFLTLKVFGVIYVLLYLNMVRQIRMSNPVDMLKSESRGEKPPKANWLVALAGAAVLGTAYYMAVTIDDPVSALTMFFVAVVLVIIGTYLLFIAGSVVMCRLLQKNKGYYYKSNHFVSVSSMLYRMRRNGAGLASICVLCTMVLVMLSATVCLYAGEEETLRNRYPMDIDITTGFMDFSGMEEAKNELREGVTGYVDAAGERINGTIDYSAAVFAAMLYDGRLLYDSDAIYHFNTGASSNIYQVFVVSIDDYNSLMGKNIRLEDDEAVVYFTKGMDGTMAGSFEDFRIGEDGEKYRVKSFTDGFVSNGMEAPTIIPSIFIFVNNIEEVVSPMMAYADFSGDRAVMLNWYYQFDMTGDEQKKMEVSADISEYMRQEHISSDENNGGIYSVTVECRDAERYDFYVMFGGLLFIAIFLGLVFVLATVLIIYYKQLTEGYEDCGRFEIMRKLGMTGKDIRRSINSQMLTVFLLPIVVACVHLVFAFPIVSKLLLCFGFKDSMLFAAVNVVCVLIFSVFYVLVYRITSRTYYNIVMVQ